MIINNNILSFYYNNFKAITYNLCSIFFIITNSFIPLYTDEILYFNSKIIEYISINYKLNTESKRINFINFMNNIIEKNNDIIKKLQIEKELNENINNYSVDNSSDNSLSDSISIDSNDNNKNENSSSDILPELVNMIDNNIEKKSSDNDIFKFEK
jgi:cell division protein FtsX|tara:strand:+ start:1155 stop:1622 length:468 start_codon:yes stop_codon:yes gene_type:complete